LAPQGLVGGGAGRTGAHHLQRGSERIAIAAKTTFPLLPGDVIEVQTAGGGGYGSPTPSDGGKPSAPDLT
jgi:N-methylhydantoinase B/oxoprolinase/acetone carboxylase alpha subunit